MALLRFRVWMALEVHEGTTYRMAWEARKAAPGSGEPDRVLVWAYGAPAFRVNVTGSPSESGTLRTLAATPGADGCMRTVTRQLPPGARWAPAQPSVTMAAAAEFESLLAPATRSVAPVFRTVA